MVEEQNQQKRLKRLKFLSVLLNRAGWTFLVAWLVGVPLLLPSLLPQANRGKGGLGGTNNIKAINRAQEALFLESGKFADSMNDLGLGIRQSEHYDYSIVLSNQKNVVFSLAIPRTSNLRMFVGVVASFEDPTTKEKITTASLCMAECLGTVKESVIPKYKQYLQHRSIAINSDDDVKCDFGDGTVNFEDPRFYLF